MISMPQTIVTPDKDAVISEVQIAAPPERIFEALTSSDQLMRWWNGSDGPCRVKQWEFEARVGGRWRCAVEDPSQKMLPGGEGTTTGEIVEFDPPHTLTYSWLASFHSRPEIVTLVRWRLVPNLDGTLVTMTHSGLKALPEGAGYAEGWPGILDSLKRFAETQ